MRHVARLRQLRELVLTFSEVRGPGLARLESMRHLDTLFLTNTAFGDSTAVYLSRLTRLKNLSLELTNITDAGRGSRR